MANLRLTLMLAVKVLAEVEWKDDEDHVHSFLSPENSHSLKALKN